MPAVDWGYQVVPYTGDGVAGREVATVFPLNSGRVAVFIYPYGIATAMACLRHSSMAQTTIDGFGLGTLFSTIITGFTATGFTLGLGSGPNTNFNALGNTYVAIVLRDLTAAGDWMRVGNYTGDGIDGHAVTIDAGGWAPTHVWVAGRSFTYRSTDFAGDASILLNNQSPQTISDGIQSFTATGFTVGRDNNVNNLPEPYFYVAFKSTADFRAAGFHSFKSTGTGAVGDPVTGFGFAPVYVIARDFQTASNAALFRSQCSHVGTASQVSGAGIDPSTGIRSLDADGFTAGEAIAPNAVDFYGYGWKGDGVSCGSSYDGFNLTGGFTSYDTFAHGTDSGGGVGCQPTFSPGTDSGGGSGCQVAL